MNTYECTDPNTGDTFRTSTKLHKGAATIFTDGINSKACWFKSVNAALADVEKWGTTLAANFMKVDPAELEELQKKLTSKTGGKPNGGWGIARITQELDTIAEAEAAADRRKIERQRDEEVKKLRLAIRGTMADFCDALGGASYGSDEYFLRMALRWLRDEKDDWLKALVQFNDNANRSPTYAMEHIDGMFELAALVEVHDNVEIMFDAGWHIDEIETESARMVGNYMRHHRSNKIDQAKADAWWAFQDMLTRRF